MGRSVGRGRWWRVRRVGTVTVVGALLALTGCHAAGSSSADGRRHAGAPGAVPAPAVADVAYAPRSGTERLDLWLPPSTTPPAPLVVYVHGGAFSGGDQHEVSDLVPSLLDAGYAVASVSYRLTSEAGFPAGVQDVKAAVRWLRANAGTYGIDPAHFAAWGRSAGGTLVGLLGTTGDQATLFDDPGLGNAGTSSAVQAVVDWFGPIDFSEMEPQAIEVSKSCRDRLDHAAADSPESRWMGAQITTIPGRVAQANPLTYLGTARTVPPFSIAHGDADCVVPWLQSQMLADALSADGQHPQLTILKGARHMDPRFVAERLGPTVAWLDGVFGR